MNLADLDEQIYRHYNASGEMPSRWPVEARYFSLMLDELAKNGIIPAGVKYADMQSFTWRGVTIEKTAVSSGPVLPSKYEFGSLEYELTHHRARRNCNWSRLYLPEVTADQVKAILKRDREFGAELQQIFIRHYPGPVYTDYTI